jgi:hypothetical protein
MSQEVERKPRHKYEIAQHLPQKKSPSRFPLLTRAKSCVLGVPPRGLPIQAECSAGVNERRADHGVMNDWSDEETDDPIHADRRNFYKVEKWSRDGQQVAELLFAGSSLDKARRIFDRMTKLRPRIRLTIRQRTRVLQHWPP